MSSRRRLILGLVSSVVSRISRPLRTLAQQDTPPPPMVLRAEGGGEQEGGIGTYCWTTQCVDMAGTPYPRCPLMVSAGEALTLDYSDLGFSRRLSYAVWRYAENQSSRSGRIEGEPVRDGAILYPRSSVSMPLDLPPGLYVMEVFIRFRSGGDTQQGFKLLVEAASDAATPEAGVVATPMTGPVCADSGG